MTRYSDPFTRTAASSIGSQYLELSTSASSSWKTTGTTAESLSTNTNNALLTATLGPTTPDQYIAATLTNALGASAGVEVRCENPSGALVTGYRFRLTQTGGAIVKLNGASANTTLADAPHTRSAPDRIALVVTGDGTAGKPVTLVAYIDGVEHARFVDTTAPYITTGRVGLANASTAGVGYDDLDTGDYTVADATGVNGVPPPASAPPGQVTGVTVTGISDVGFTVNWTTDPAAASYLVEYKRTADATYTSVTVQGQASASRAITGLTAATSYDVRITAVNGIGSGPPSAVVTASTAAAPTTPPTQVVGLTAGTATGSTQPLTWTAAAGATTYTVEYRLGGTADPYTAVTGLTGTTYTVTGLSPVTSYQYRVTAVNAAGSGTPSTTLTTATGATTVVTETINQPNLDGLHRWRGLTHNLAGERILAGGVLHRMTADFWGNPATYVFPEWLTCPEGTATLSTGLGKMMKLATAASAGARATLRLAVPVVSTEVGLIEISLRHCAFSIADPVADWRLFAADAAAGSSAIQLNGMGAIALTSQGEANRTRTAQGMLGEDAGRRRHTGLLVSTVTKEAWLLEGDAIIGYRDCAATWTDGTLQVGVSVTAQSATAAELRFASLHVTLYSRDVV